MRGRHALVMDSRALAITRTLGERHRLSSDEASALADLFHLLDDFARASRFAVCVSCGNVDPLHDELCAVGALTDPR